MQKSSLPVGIKTLYKYYTESKTLDLDCPIQRASGQWNNLAASMLIHSILSDYIIPNLYFRKESRDGTNYLSVLDGKQRLSTVFSFIDDEWMTHAKTPKVVFDGEEYDISLKKFSELNDDLKSAIMGYRFTNYQLENCTDEEIEETFARLNAGTPLSKIQQARPKMGMSLADWCNKLVASDFFQKSLNLTLAQLRREDDFLCLLTTMMLLDDKYYNDFAIKTSASAAECVRFAESIKNNYSEDKKETVELLVEYLNEAFGSEEYKFLRKNNIPIVMYVGFVALNKGVTAEEYKSCVVDFFEKGCSEAYNEASGSGNVKMVNVNIRLKELLGYIASALPNYFEDVSENSEVTEQEQTSDDATGSTGILNQEEIDKHIEEAEKEGLDEQTSDTAIVTPVEVEPEYVLYHLTTGREDQEEDVVYEVYGVVPDYLNDIGFELAVKNAEAYGVDISENASDNYSWEILEDMTKEEIEEEYGAIHSLVTEDSNEE